MNRIKLNTKSLPKVKWVGVKESRYGGKIGAELEVKSFIVLADIGDGLGNRPVSEIAAEYGMLFKGTFNKRELANECADEVFRYWGKEDKKPTKKTSVSMRLEEANQRNKALEEQNKTLEERIAQLEKLFNAAVK